MADCDLQRVFPVEAPGLYTGIYAASDLYAGVLRYVFFSHFFFAAMLVFANSVEDCLCSKYGYSLQAMRSLLADSPRPSAIYSVEFVSELSAGWPT